MAVHPDLQAEQEYVDHAYACLEAARERARQMRSLVEVGAGGTHQARYERDVIEERIHQRLDQLEIGDASLCFGRIDQEPEAGAGRYYIGRLAVADDEQEPVIVDWRAPVAEAFYRATGRVPMGLECRRHFTSRGRSILAIDDELFGEAVAGLDDRISGHGALISALETSRTGRLSDIVATIQGEQDEIIRAPMPGVLVVQGGPGTGKTVVALHRAAYLLYSHRFPLEDQGVLVVGPNRLFLGYIEQVLPSLGEAGVEMVVLGDLVDGLTVAGAEDPGASHVKGDLRMIEVLRRAVRDRERPLRETLEVGYGATYLRLSVGESRRIVKDARRRFRSHNPGRRFVEQAVYDTLARSARTRPSPDDVRDALHGTLPLREALERMWPVLTPAQLLNDLYGSPALLRSAAAGSLSPDQVGALERPRAVPVDDARWTAADGPVLDEARVLLGPPPRFRGDWAPRTYGHIVIDEAQDLSPMQLRMVARRSLNGSMTIVGDIAQATGAWAHQGWDEVLALLPDKRPPRTTELTIGYRIPARTMELAARVLTEAAPGLQPPRSVREGDDPPRFVRATDRASLGDAVAATVREEREAVGAGNIAVVCPGGVDAEVASALAAAGIDFGDATRQGLDHQVTVVPVRLVKGLEVDAAVVVEPARIVSEELQGTRALYVALTRATKRLAIVNADALPPALGPG